MAEIEDGFMRIAYDFKVSSADKRCVFDVFESDEDKFVRWSEEGKKKGNPDMARVLNRAGGDIRKKYKEYKKGGKLPSISDIFSGIAK